MMSHYLMKPGVIIGLRCAPDSLSLIVELQVFGSKAECPGLVWFQQDVVELFRHFGGTLSEERVYAAHIAIDVAHVASRTFCDLCDREHFASRVSKRNIVTKRSSAGAWTLEIGTGVAPAQLVIYDKCRQIRSEAELLAAATELWKGKLPSEATRVELRAKRSWLTHLGIDTLNDLIIHRKLFIERMMCHYCRFLTDTYVPRSKIPIHELWSRIFTEALSWAKSSSYKAPVVLARPREDRTKQCVQNMLAARGLIVRVAAESRVVIGNDDDFLDFASKQLRPLLRGDASRLVRQRRVELGIGVARKLPASPR
jgi:hypothetical protein